VVVGGLPPPPHKRVSPPGKGLFHHPASSVGLRVCAAGVGRARRELGMYRRFIQSSSRLYVACGPDRLHSGRLGARLRGPATLSVKAEQAILALAITWLTWAFNRLCSFDDPSAGHGKWRPEPPIAPCADRGHGPLGAPGSAGSSQRPGSGPLDQTHRESAGALSERFLAGRAGQPEYLCVGKPKGVCKLWQDAVCEPYARTALLRPVWISQPRPRLTSQLLAHCQLSRGGLQVQRALTDQGNHFFIRFDQVCDDGGIRTAVPKLGSHESLASSSTCAGSSCMDSGTHPRCSADSPVQASSPGGASSQAWCR